MKLKVNNDGIRLDKYIKDNTSYSREYITKMIKNGYVLVNNKNLKPSYLVKIDDEIELLDGFTISQDISKKEMPLDIVFEDEYLMVINKPSGLVVHPGAGNKDNTLVNGLKYYTDNLSSISGEDRVGIVHRLDKDTSGLMIVCKDDTAHSILSEDFKYKRVYREYYALLVGEFKANTAFIDAPIGRSKENFNKMEIMESGKDARTNLKVIKRYKGYTLVSLVLETGRTHQIRVHMKYIGYPIYNDPVYLNKKSTPFGQFLHSKTLKFTHPITKKEYMFESNLPKEFSDFLKTLDEY